MDYSDSIGRNPRRNSGRNRCIVFEQMVSRRELLTKQPPFFTLDTISPSNAIKCQFEANGRAKTSLGENNHGLNKNSIRHI